MKITTTFEKEENVKFFSVQVDRTYLRFTNNKASIDLEPGVYYVSWIARGKAGDSYELNMISPHQEQIVKHQLSGDKGGGVKKIII